MKIFMQHFTQVELHLNRQFHNTYRKILDKLILSNNRKIGSRLNRGLNYSLKQINSIYTHILLYLIYGICVYIYLHQAEDNPFVSLCDIVIYFHQEKFQRILDKSLK